jgi:hypothetical protein
MTGKKSLLGIVSVLAPPTLAVLWLIVEKNPSLGQALNGYAGMFIYIFLLLASVAGIATGFICGVISFFRESKPLAIAGLAANAAAIIWFLGLRGTPL